MRKKTIYAKEYRDLVDGLRRIRKDRGLTQAALAEALGWPQQRLSSVESGSRRLDVMEYFVLTDKLGLSPESALELILTLRPKGRGR
ncbi:helix-turn-helix transcriptional regulator [Arenimonas sp.]|uniref:helix-turn-helix domain-containing protein n=1 Tax=Arenimonas sp. TaxID=1872635 RepID=UPI0025D6A4D5|nr:helix-turn-helix transcriptional regulator [Arenimonas sp.]